MSEIKIIAIIAARGGSKRVPKKNIKELLGKPLIAYIIETAFKSKVFDRVVVSTDDEEIVKVAKKYGAEVPFIRPKELATDSSLVVSPFKHVIKWLEDNENYKADVSVLLQAPSPFVKPEQIKNTVDKLIYSNADVVYTVNEVDYPPYWMQKLILEEGNFKPELILDRVDLKNKQSQDLPKTYRPNGAVCAIKTEVLLKWDESNALSLPTEGINTRVEIIDKISGFDIDSAEDFLIAETIMNKMHKEDEKNECKSECRDSRDNSKIKIVLVNPSITKEEYLGKSSKCASHTLPPLGLCYLAAVLRKNNFEVKIIDASGLNLTMKETIDQIVEFNPKYIGVTSTIISIYPARDLVAELKKRTNAKIILGGPHVSAVPEETLRRFPEFEVAVISEGEDTLLELINTLEDGGDLKKVDGLVLRQNDEIFKTQPRKFIQNLDELPLPAYDLLSNLTENYRPSELTYHRLPSTSVITSRGCPHQCTFCDRSVFGNKWRFHSAEYIMKIVKQLYDNFGIVDFYFTDDHFTVNKERLKKICNAIIESKMDIVWSTIGRLDYVDPEILKLMKEAGCQQIAYGIESGNQDILNIIKKGITLDQIRKGVKMTKDAGMEVKGLFMAGNPTETKETLKQTIDLIKELDLDYFCMSAFTPLPGSESYKDASKYGSFDDDWKKINLQDVLFVPHGLTKEYIEQFIKRGGREEVKLSKESIEKEIKKSEVKLDPQL